jgi:hypothetical protein
MGRFMSKMVVIARYKEDVTWCYRLSCNKIIYNKFYDDENYLPNIGREAHTYLTYIVDNYDNLCDLTVFTQGDPRVHCSDFVDSVNGLDELVGFRGLSSGNYQTYCDGLPHHYHPTSLKIKEFCDMFDFKPPVTWWFNGNAIFAVNRRLILRHGLDFYKSILDYINKDVDLPWVLERLWYPIFKGYFYNKIHL